MLYLVRTMERRQYLEEDEENWVCERCGQLSEEGLAWLETGRCTRSDPKGEKCVCMCGWCAQNMSKGGYLYGKVVSD